MPKVEVRRLDDGQIEGQAETIALARDPQAAIRAVQVALYIMVGGGLTGSRAVEQPHDFFIDDRNSTVYPLLACQQTARILARACAIANVDPVATWDKGRAIPNLGVL